MTSLVVSTLQEAAIAVNRLYHIALAKKTTSGKRASLLLSSGVWVAGSAISAATIMVPRNGLSNRLCLGFNYLEGDSNSWSPITALFPVVYVISIGVVWFSLIRIHWTVVDSASEIKRFSERKLGSTTAYRKKLFLTLLVYSLSKVSVIILVLLPLVGTKASARIHIWIVGPCIALSALRNPLVYRRAKHKC
jgi:hypothetical protein